ncbi:MAG: hypothetical protein Kow0075_02150 [Salibacteraceae bacterium]
MVTVISGTNRTDNVSIKIAGHVLDMLTNAGEDCQLLDLRKLPRDFVFANDAYGNADPGFTAIAQQFVACADKFVFVVPEYNGSIPGVCKAFIDAVWPEQFKYKKAALVGLSSGRAGNLRGLDHLTNILNYLQVVVLPEKVNITHVDKHLGEDGLLTDELTMSRLRGQMERLISF